MSVGLLLPAALGALAALLLPLLIHLARRKVLDPVDFAALRWLQIKPHPRQRLRFEQWPLLLLRLLLLAMLALWLAQPVLRGSADRRPTIAVMPGVSVASIAQETLPENARRLWLATGFPVLEAPAPRTIQPISSLLRQLDADLPEANALIVLATAQFDGADAQRPHLARPVDWRIVAGTPPHEAVRQAAPPRLSVHADAAHAVDARYLRAAAIAWHGDAAGHHLLGPDDPLPDASSGVLAWLDHEPLPAAWQRWIEAGGTALLAADTPAPTTLTAQATWPDGAGAFVLEGAPMGHGQLLRFTQPPQPQRMPALLDPDFAQRLLAAVQPAPAAPTRADALAHAPIHDATPYPPIPQDLRPWLAILIALLFLGERWLATRTRRASAT